MGRPKALLDWHGLTAVEHAVEVVREGIAGGPVSSSAPRARSCRRSTRSSSTTPSRSAVRSRAPRGSRGARGGPRSRSHAESTHRCSYPPSSTRCCASLRRRRRRRAGDRRSRTAAARCLPRGGRPPPRGVARRTEPGLRDIPTCARARAPRAGASCGCGARRRRPRPRSAVNANTPEGGQRWQGSPRAQASSTSPLSTSTLSPRSSTISSRPSGRSLLPAPTGRRPGRVAANAFRCSSSSANRSARRSASGVAPLELPQHRSEESPRSNGRSASAAMSQAPRRCWAVRAPPG